MELLVAAVVTAIIGLILYARWNYGTLESLGLTVVKPLHVFLGNTADFHAQVVHLQDIERFKTYGPVYGVYEGREPQVHVCDAEILKCIMVKDYEHFKDRRPLDFGSPLLNEMPDFLHPYNKWKAVRNLLTPSFTAAKMKHMSSSMSESLDDFNDMLKSKLDESGKIEKCNLRQEVYTMLTDMIARCVFSVKIENKHDVNNHFAKLVKAIVEGEGSGSLTPNFGKSLSFSFPFLKKYLCPDLFDAKAGIEFVKVFKSILESRKKSGAKQKDFVDNVIDWLDKLDTPEFKDNKITELTIMCQALVFFFAGQDQISSIVSNCVLEAAKNKKVEDKIYEELDVYLEKHKGKIEYDTMNELVYLQACLTESTRLVPFFSRAERVCTKDWEMDGLRITKGVTVVLPIWAANRNPKHFPDPETFDPERFLSPNKEKLHPYAMTSFGHGPKNCIGMRFSTDAMLLTAAHLYNNFRFKARADSQKIAYFPGSQFFAMPDATYIDVLTK